MEVIRAVFSMVTPIIISEPLHFDAVLTAVHPNALPQPWTNNRLREKDLPDLPLPLKKAVSGDDWVWCASTCSLDDEARPYSGTHTKRKSREDVFFLQKNVMVIGGVFKDWIISDQGFSTRSLSFLAEPTDMKELAWLCSRITHFGKLRGMGYGQVSGFRLEELGSKSWKDCLVQGIRAARDLPQSFIYGGFGWDYVNVHPPYWDMDRRVSGVATGNVMTLAPEVALC